MVYLIQTKKTYLNLNAKLMSIKIITINEKYFNSLLENDLSSFSFCFVILNTNPANNNISNSNIKPKDSILNFDMID